MGEKVKGRVRGGGGGEREREGGMKGVRGSKKEEGREMEGEG